MIKTTIYRVRENVLNAYELVNESKLSQKCHNKMTFSYEFTNAFQREKRRFAFTYTLDTLSVAFRSRLRNAESREPLA